VLGDQPVVKRGEVQRTVAVLAAPVFDRFGHRRRLGFLLRAAVDRAGLHASGLVPHRALRHPKQPRDLAVRDALGRQCPDRHSSLQIELAHPRLRPRMPMTALSNPNRPLVNLGVALPQRYGVALHKKLGRIERLGHRITGDRRDTVPRAGWEMLFVAIDDHARIGFTQMQPDERGPSAVAFLRAAVAYYASLGITVRRVLTDNGSPFMSCAWRNTCAELGIVQKRTRAYRPQTNGKAERFIQSAPREWAYGIAYDHSSERTAMLAKWQHHYNWHRPHAGIGGLPPMSRLKSASGNNVLTLHS
jgi:transposase InsO family protein